jgi:hypothetical protein
MNGSVTRFLFVWAVTVPIMCLPGLCGEGRASASLQRQSDNGVEQQERVTEPEFSPERGFYSAPFEVTITCDTPDATVYYTLDGSEPYDTLGRSPTAKVYTGPLRIKKTTCLRARAVRDGWMPSNIGTHTYIFLSDVIARTQGRVLDHGYPDTWYSDCPADYEMDPDVCYDMAYANLMDEALLAIPTVSLITNKDSLFSQSNDPQTGGIYIYTGHSSTGGNGWERPVSMELFTPDGATGFQASCGLQIEGDESRDPLECPKHSFGLRFRSKYGQARLDFPLFDGGPVESFDSLQLRGFFHDTWTHPALDRRRRAQYVRDQWMRDSLLEMGQADAGRGIYVHLYLNGIYWGLYNLHEQLDAGHYARYNGGDPERIDTLDGDPTCTGSEPGRLANGTIDTWLELQGIVASRDWDRICSVLDVDSFIDWSILNALAGAMDIQPGSHWRAAGGGPDRRSWRFYTWDAERVLEITGQNGTRPSSDPTGLFDFLDDIQEFRGRFGDRVHRHLFHKGALTAERSAQRWLRRAGEIEPAIIAESARWGDYRRDVHPYGTGPYHLYTRNAFWLPEKNRLLNEYFPRRTGIVLEQFKSRGLYPAIDAPTFHIEGTYQHGGPVTSGSMLTMQGGAGTIWYTLDGTDPRRPALAARATVHTLVGEDAAKRALVPTQDIDDSWKGGAPFNDFYWTLVTGAPGGVGYEHSGGYEPLISLDVEDQMYEQNATCYIRIPFHLAVDPGRFNHLTLRIHYDDDFVAYLNGVEIKRAMFKGHPAWDSAAGGTHEADDPELFAVSDSLHLLRYGDNVLAIHGLNSARNSSDFIILASLEAVESTAVKGGGVCATATQYVGPVTVDRTMQVKARVLNGTNWSALNEAVFTVGPTKAP